MTGQPDGSVRVPQAAAAELLRVAVVGLAEVARRNGERPPVGRDVLAVLHALHEAATETPSARGSESVATQTIEESYSSPRTGTVRVMAARLGCSERYVRQLIRAGRLRATKPGRDWQIDLDSHGAPDDRT